MFNAIAMKHITKQYRDGMIYGWTRLQKDIEFNAYNGYDFYILNPRQWCYIDRLKEYGFNVVEDEVNYNFVVRWDT